ncbi:glycoside hydrolase family 97 protein [Sphingomonas mollis]|uniref:Glycoside hydrolase family 97 protein n=1 Tax=Sphingomonas mollis TaxID=2795726 RepID=A0ABS0XNP9_9SPHN|nr:glycoside hydrolase family 97 protein [Sphingomonas sp. BT553]MBJ6121658.1 glycoside hydrolase family 97 protein [Sphingomonas sp. BT553]
MRLGTILLGNVAIIIAAPAAAQNRLDLASPDGTITLSIASDGNGPPKYEVTRHGEAVLAPSPLGFDFTDGSRTDALRMAEVRRAAVDRTVPLVATKAASARDHYNELVVSLADPAGKRGPIELDLRAYDDGIAFRYRLPGGDQPIAIREERTGFYFPTNDRCWGLNVGRATSSHEGEYDPVRVSQVRPMHMFDPGMLCKTGSDRTSFVIAEAGLANYAGLYLRGREDGGLGLDTRLAPLPGELRTAVRAAAGQSLTSSWRVVMMADRAGDLIASNLIGNLNPPATGDWRWIQPGKSAWDWWSGPYFPGQAQAAMNMADLKKLIDFAGASGLRYMLIDEGWALNSGVGGSAPADTDITKTQAGLDMPDLVRYAAARKVDLMLWLQWSQLDARMAEAMDQYARWGIKGIKVDFMDRNDQVMVDYYHRVLAEAAKRHLLVDLHGAYQPTGLNRTYPNYVTQEGVMGAEYNKWSKRVTATHNVSLAFTRMVLGPLDYTPGGFRNRTPADFKPVNSPPQVQTTRGQALAMYVVYESPVQMVSDSPDAYRGQPEFAFVRDVPTTWDETRFLDGDIGSHVVVARRKGRDWYIGAMNGAEGRTVTLPLAFLGKGRFAATIWQDGARADKVALTEHSVGANDTLTLQLAAAGGAAVRLRAGR